MRARRRHTALVLTAMAAIVLTGCQQPPAPMSQMQTLVVDAADQIAGGDTATATATLDALEAEVATRLGAGEIDAAEADRIRAAVALVRADLASLITPTPEPETTEPTETTETTEPVEPAEPTTPAVEPVAPVEPTVTETEEADDTEDAPGNSGNTPGNNGNDKDKDKKKD